ncbi:MAG TPA: hypothetical protein VF840_00110 [Terriglobales bacterium]
MPGLSTARKLGIFGRIAARQAGQSRWLRAGYSALQITFRHFGRVVHLLWLQITGVFFLFFALAGGLACWREYQAWQAGKIGPGKMVLAACFALVFLWFGVSSFWRAKRRSGDRAI